MKFENRDVPPRSAWALEQAGVAPTLARLLAARGVHTAQDLDEGLAHLLRPSDMLGMAPAAKLLADCIQAQKRLCIVADYDCDGATACAVGLRGLRMLGAQHVSYLVPNRVEDGYGLTAPIAERVAQTGAQLLITVDNGIASIEGTARARALGLQTLITDHHLPAMPLADGTVPLPDADALVNPNQPGCTFESKSMAGVGVMFYVLLATRAELRTRGAFDAASQPKLDALLPLVALGTVADVVKLDANNRRLVAQGLQRIRRQQAPIGILALMQAAGRQPHKASTFDFGFALGPRINAAGRMSDMRLGIECLSTDDTETAQTLAQQLDAINRERREVEAAMRAQAEEAAAALFDEADEPPAAITVFDESFHEGIVGIVAGRLKDRLHRPTFVFAPSAAAGQEEVCKGSGRSIAGFHLRDALDLLAKRHPGVLMRFGGHAMAAGCTVHIDAIAEFEAAFEQIAAEWLDAATLQRKLLTDGKLSALDRQLSTADALSTQVWGNGFEAPVFADDFEVASQRLLAEKHLGLKLRQGEQLLDAVWFGRTEPLPPTARLAYRLEADEWQGRRSLKLHIVAMST